MALNGDDIPPRNKRLELGNDSRETSEERTYNGADRFSDNRDSSSVVQNGECGPKDKEDLDKNSDKKVSDLKNESLLNGKIKTEAETGDRVMENGKDECDKSGVAIKTEVKEESIKEEAKEHGETVKSEQVKTESNPSLSQESPSCNGFTDNQDAGNKQETNSGENCESKSSESKTKEKSLSPPKELPPTYDPTPHLPRIDDFELVVTSVEQLRELIKKFGDLPDGAGGSKEGNGGEEEGNSGKKSKVSVYLGSHEVVVRKL